MDFGIAACKASEHLTTNGFMWATPAYMAPEQVRGEEVDPRMDSLCDCGGALPHAHPSPPFHGDTAIAMIHRN